MEEEEVDGAVYVRGDILRFFVWWLQNFNNYYMHINSTS